MALGNIKTLSSWQNWIKMVLNSMIFTNF